MFVKLLPSVERNTSKRSGVLLAVTSQLSNAALLLSFFPVNDTRSIGNAPAGPYASVNGLKAGNSSDRANPLLLLPGVTAVPATPVTRPQSAPFIRATTTPSPGPAPGTAASRFRRICAALPVRREISQYSTVDTAVNGSMTVRSVYAVGRYSAV